MKKIIIIFLIISCFTIGYCQAEKFYSINGKLYIENSGNIVQDSFDVCQCIKATQKIYVQKDINELNKMCVEAYLNYLMEESERLDKIIVGSYTNEYCYN